MLGALMAEAIIGTLDAGIFVDDFDQRTKDFVMVSRNTKKAIASTSDGSIAGLTDDVNVGT